MAALFMEEVFIKQLSESAMHINFAVALVLWYIHIHCAQIELINEFPKAMREADQSSVIWTLFQLEKNNTEFVEIDQCCTTANAWGSK